MKKYETLGFTYEEAKEMERELSINIHFDMGVIGLSDNLGSSYEEIEEKLLAYIEEKYDIVIPRENMKRISADGDQLYAFQDLGFYWGFIYEKSEAENRQDTLSYVKEGYFVHDDHIDYLELSSINFEYPERYEYRCDKCDDDGIPYYVDFTQDEVSKYVLTLEEAKLKLLG